MVESLMINVAACFVQHQDGGSREGCVGSGSFPPAACGHCQRQDPRTLPSSNSLYQYSPPLRFTAHSLAATQSSLLRVSPLEVSLCPADTYSLSLSPTDRSPQRAARFYSWILKELLEQNMSICSEPSVKPCPLRIYVAFLSRHEPKDDTLGIHHHSLCSWNNGILRAW